MEKTRIAVLVSGRGSNLQALIDACRDPAYPAQIVLVLSNIPDAYGLTRAREAGIDTAIVDHRDHATRDAFDAAMHQVLLVHDVEFICLAGFMRILTPGFTQAWAGKMINIHPSLLPKFKGLRTHQAALDAGESEHGCTIHWVTAELDSGAVIAQAHVPILANDTADTLATRVLAEENKLYPATLEQLLTRKE